MLRSFQKTRGAVTLFHLPSSKVSTALASFVNKTYKASGCHLFDIEITEKKPTNQQTKSIVSFLSSKQKSMSVESADADLPTELTSLGVVRPILVDWFNGKVSINNEEEAKQLLADLAKQAEES